MVRLAMDFVKRNNDNFITVIKVKFDAIDEIVNAERKLFSFEVLKGIYYTSKQFPLMAAFAITIHKSQGLSLKSAVIDASSTCFGSGMVYVALSRVTSLAGVHLIDLDKTWIQYDNSAVKEYNRLRRLYMPHLGDLAVVQPTRKCNTTTGVESLQHYQTPTAGKKRKQKNEHANKNQPLTTD